MEFVQWKLTNSKRERARLYIGRKQSEEEEVSGCPSSNNNNNSNNSNNSQTEAVAVRPHNITYEPLVTLHFFLQT